ncbi:MAG: hypothetical protein QG635_784, partial [Bacteroidota bacterium]|nr:hypothetical protein [Bacteroidota bacterium]
TSVSKVIGFEYGKSDVVPINEFLEKPVQTTKLLEIIEKLLN